MAGKRRTIINGVAVSLTTPETSPAGGCGHVDPETGGCPCNARCGITGDRQDCCGCRRCCVCGR